MTRATTTLGACAVLALCGMPAFADDLTPPVAPVSEAVAAAADSVELPPPPATVTVAPAAKPKAHLEALVPDVAAHPWRIEPGPRPFRHRLSFSPAYGNFGENRFFAARLGYNPDPWLGYEWSIGHTPGQSTHAALHTISAVLRYPLPGRFQPCVSGGYGMVLVYPGPSINAAPVTKNALLAGLGLEFYLRGDLALRADVRHATVFGRQRDREGVVTYSYGQQTLGLAFSRTLAP